MSGELAKVNVDWLQEYQEKDKSLEKMQEHRVLARAMIIQGLSRKKEAKKEYGEGAVIMIPGDHKIIAAGSTFYFVPIFFFEDYIQWRDINDPSDDSAIVERSLDPKSEIALKALDKDRRREQYGEKNDLTMKYQEHLNFTGVIYGPEGHPLQDQAITLTFSSGEHWNGQSFCSAIASRRANGRRIPSWAQVWAITTEEHNDKRGNTWFGYRYGAPADASLTIDPQYAPSFKAMHEELRQQYENKVLEVDFSDADDADDVESSDSL